MSDADYAALARDMPALLACAVSKVNQAVHGAEGGGAVQGVPILAFSHFQGCMQVRVLLQRTHLPGCADAAASLAGVP